MMKAQNHPFEEARLAALRAYDILDTPRESDFDDIVMLAARICDVPISVINLIDEGRQWFKAETGLGVRETPLDTSICAHVILEEEFVEIPDTLADPRMADNPLCLADSGLRFYSGALLRSKDGYPIGTLCVLDNRPRVLEPLQRDALRILADQVMTQLDLRAHIANETMLRREIDHRVKNSLQIVSAFVSLELGMERSDEVRSSLKRVAQQINTVAVLHDHLGISGENAHVELQPYLDQVVKLIDQSLPASTSVIGTFDNVTVLPREASIVGTIINELAANAFKHSISGSSGTINLSGKRLATNRYRLICQDDAGQGAVDLPPTGRIGLGMQILKASVRQLGGTMTATTQGPGYRTDLSFAFSDD